MFPIVRFHGSFLSREMHALRRRPKRRTPDDIADEGSDNDEGGILAQRAARREAARLRATEEANVSPKLLCAHINSSIYLQQTTSGHSGIPPRPLSPPPSSPATRRPPNTDMNESRGHSPLDDLTPSPRPHSDNDSNRSPSPGQPPAGPTRHPVNRAMVRHPLILRFSRNANTSSTATAHGPHQTQPPSDVGISGGPSRRLPPVQFGPTRNISPTPSMQSPRRQTQPLESTRENRPDNPPAAPKQKILVPAKKATKTRASRKRK